MKKILMVLGFLICAITVQAFDKFYVGQTVYIQDCVVWISEDRIMEILVSAMTKTEQEIKEKIMVDILTEKAIYGGT